jgi:hypothetical protein
MGRAGIHLNGALEDSALIRRLHSNGHMIVPISRGTARKESIKGIRQCLFACLLNENLRISNELDPTNLLPMPRSHGISITAQQAIGCGFVVGELTCRFRAANGYVPRSFRAWDLEISDESVTFCCTNAPTRAILHKR